MKWTGALLLYLVTACSPHEHEEWAPVARANVSEPRFPHSRSTPFEVNIMWAGTCGHPDAYYECDRQPFYVEYECKDCSLRTIPYCEECLGEEEAHGIEFKNWADLYLRKESEGILQLDLRLVHAESGAVEHLSLPAVRFVEPDSTLLRCALLRTSGEEGCASSIALDGEDTFLSMRTEYFWQGEPVHVSPQATWTDSTGSAEFLCDNPEGASVHCSARVQSSGELALQLSDGATAEFDFQFTP